MAKLSLLIALLALVQVATCSKELVDRKPIDVAAEELCKHASDKRIGSVSTIYKLLEHYEASTTGSACKDEWYLPLQSLKFVLDASVSDACSWETIEKIEEFHWFYVVGTLSKSWRKTKKGSLPEPLRQFFVHFADATAAKCKTVMGDRLKEAVGGQVIDSSQMFNGNLGVFSEILAAMLVPREKVSRYEDFFLVFNSLADLDRRRGHPMPEATPDPVTGEITYIYLRMRDTSSPRTMQNLCRQELRPIYANTILPVMRLIDLGHGLNGDELPNEVKDLVANWYTVAQVCEIISPIKYYEDKSLWVGKLSMVRKADAEEMDLANGYDSTPRPPNVKVQSAKLDDELPAATDDGAVQRVKASIKSRSKVYSKTLKQFLKRYKKELGKIYKGIYYWVKNKVTGKYEEKQIDESSLTDVDKYVSSELEEKSSAALARSKRSAVGWILGLIAFAVVAFLIVSIILAALHVGKFALLLHG